MLEASRYFVSAMNITNDLALTFSDGDNKGDQIIFIYKRIQEIVQKILTECESKLLIN